MKEYFSILYLGVFLFSLSSCREEGESKKKVLAKGLKLFNTSCVQCHLKGGVGQIGPNLTDDYWIHGPTRQDIMYTVKNGVVSKGMQAFKNQFSEQDINAVVTYVESLRGLNAKGGKEPQGFLYKMQDGKFIKDESTSVKTTTINVPDNIPVISVKGASIEKGKRLFNITLGCAHCHGTDAYGHIDNRDITASKERYGENWLRVIDQTLYKGRSGTAMQAWDYLPKKQLRDLKAFIISVQKKD